MKRQPPSNLRPRAHQRGVVLIIALVVMVAMIMASLALVRSVDITTQIAGNLAFRQSGVQAGDFGTELARKFLMARAPGDLWNDIGPSYYSTWNGGAPASTIFDPATFNWTGKTVLPQGAAGNTVAYVVHRMCQNPGDPGDPTKNCLTVPTSGSGNSNRIREGGEFACTGTNCGTSNNPYYRITARVSGPRNTVTFVQVVIY